MGLKDLEIRDPSQVIADALSQTDFPVAAENIRVEFEEEHGKTQIYVFDRDITVTKEARLALRQAIGQTLTAAYSEQEGAFSDQPDRKGLHLDTDHGIDMGPPMCDETSEKSMLYQFRACSPNHVDLRPFISAIEPADMARLFKSHLHSGPDPDASKGSFTML